VKSSILSICLQMVFIAIYLLINKEILNAAKKAVFDALIDISSIDIRG